MNPEPADTRATYFATFGVDNLEVVRAFKAHTPARATEMAVEWATCSSFLTGREWVFRKLGIYFPGDLVKEYDDVDALVKFAQHLKRSRISPPRKG